MIVAADSDSKFLAYSPSYICRMIIVAAAVLLRTIKSQHSASVDIIAGKRNFNAAILFLNRYSLEDYDTYRRSSKILGQLWSMYQYGITSSIDTTSLRDIGTNILYETLWTWRHTFEESKQHLEAGTLFTKSMSKNISYSHS